jgi:Co/Zn/Cd efflux system component
MFAEQKKTSPVLHNRIIWIQTLTLAWTSVEATVSLEAAWMAHSPALLAFGGDSAIELLSAAVVLWALLFTISR